MGEPSVPDTFRKRLLAGRDNIPTWGPTRIARTLSAILSNRKVLRPARGADDAWAPDSELLFRLVTSVGQLKGISMKVAQILSYVDVALPEETREALAVLQTHAQPMARRSVESIIREDLPPEAADQILSGLSADPIAAASIGQVHRAALADGTQVAVKIQYPEIRKTILSDLGVARIGPALASVVFPGAQIRGLIEEVKDRLLEECDYEHEAAMQERFRMLFHDHPVLFVPAVHRHWSGRRVLTTDLVDGLTFTDWLATDPSQEERDRAGKALFEFYLGTLFRHGLYNCDPHPGNYLFTDDGRVAMLDHGCTRRFEPSFVALLARLTRALQADDEEEVRAVLFELDIVRNDTPDDVALAKRLVRSFFGPMLRDETIAIDLDDALTARDVFRTKREMLRLMIPPEFLFLLRIRFGLMAVLAQLNARANWFRLEASFVDRT